MRTVYFEGKNFIIPGSRAAFRAKPQTTGVNADLNTLILIGTSTNGWDCNDSTLPKDLRVMEFYSFAEAKAILVSGDLLDAIKVAFSPSKTVGFSGVSKVKALNINPNTQASETFQSVDLPTTHLVKAIVPGPAGNNVRIKVSNSGGTVEIGSIAGITKSSDLNISDLQIVYTGNATTANLTWDGTTFAVSLAGQSDGTLSLSTTWQATPTIGDLINYINNQNGYVATLLSSTDLLTKNLDHIVGSTTLVGAVPATLKSVLWRQMTFLVNSELAELTPSTPKVPLADMPSFRYLIGGTTGVGVTGDYIDAIDLCESVTGFYRNVLTSTFSVATYLADHCSKMVSPEGSNETFGGAGAANTDAYATRLSNAKVLNSPWMCYGVNSLVTYQADGITEKTYDGWMLAVYHNAIKASANPRQAATNKVLNILRTDEELSPTQLINAEKSGCLTISKNPNGEYILLHGLTTYQGNNLIYNLSQTIVTALALINDLRNSLWLEFGGRTPTDPDNLDKEFDDADIRTFVDNKFDIDYIQNFGWLSRNIYTGEAAYDKNYTISRDGNVIYFNFPDGKVVSSIDYIFSLLNLDLIKGSSTGV
ncbi:MAG TPA: hypothetical protein PK079_22525 [Leptospiraceae bacterium]|nr:hypothetical protein [Leptospiraceae bacterium]HNE55958.1 hypothetical protein [Leptospiraceae bacterium]HNF57474.1 hypothetical protein [Leptospiraceae bacterium]